MKKLTFWTDLKRPKTAFFNKNSSKTNTYQNASGKHKIRSIPEDASLRTPRQSTGRGRFRGGTIYNAVIGAKLGLGEA